MPLGHRWTVDSGAVTAGKESEASEPSCNLRRRTGTPLPGPMGGVPIHAKPRNAMDDLAAASVFPVRFAMGYFIRDA
jgi:hypothetical protein